MRTHDLFGYQVLKAVEANIPNAGKFNLQEHLFGGVSCSSPLRHRTHIVISSEHELTPPGVVSP